MKYLFIGGTGNISKYITKKLLERGDTVYLVNRGNRNQDLDGDVRYITADINTEEGTETVREYIKDMCFDAVADFIVFTKEQAERDFNLFNGKCRQYLTFSSASVYQTPLASPWITEATPMKNPLWKYSQNKIEVEEFFMKKYRECDFPMTIIRPSHTYGETYLPLSVEGKGAYSVVKRMLEGKRVIIPGDGTSLWVLTHSSDFAKGFIGLLNNIHAIGETYHITTDELVTWNQVYQVVADTLGVKAKFVHVSSEFLAETRPESGFLGSLLGDKSNSSIFDNSKLKRVVPDFVCTKRMDQGIAESVRYLMSHPELQKEDPDFDDYCDRVLEALDRAKAEILGK